MKKVIILQSIFVVFLFLMTPNVNSIEYQNQKNIITSEIEAMDHRSFAKMVKRIPSCDQLREIINFFIITGVFFMFAIILYFYGKAIGCWDYKALSTNTDVPCSSCA